MTGRNGPASRLRASPNPLTPRLPRRMTWAVRIVAMLAASALLLAQCGGDSEESADGDEGTTTTTEALAAPAAPASPSATQVVATEPPPAATPPAATPVAAPTPPVSPALSGPPPVAVGSMSEMRVAGDGLAHARFVAEFFSGPVNGYSASSSDNGVATAGIRSPDLLIVAPVSNGTASVTVTASGPGGTATQTFTVRVGTGSDQTLFADAAAAAPAPAPPAAQAAEVFVPAEELSAEELPPVAPIAPDAASGRCGRRTACLVETLPAVPVTEAPTLLGSDARNSRSIVGQSQDGGRQFLLRRGGPRLGGGVLRSRPTSRCRWMPLPEW